MAWKDQIITAAKTCTITTYLHLPNVSQQQITLLVTFTEPQIDAAKLPSFQNNAKK